MESTENQNNTQNNQEKPPPFVNAAKEKADESKSAEKINKNPYNDSKPLRTKFVHFLKIVFSDANKAMAAFTAILAITAIITNITTCNQIRDTDKVTDATFKRMDKEINAFTITAKADSILAENTKKSVAISDSSYGATQKNAQITFDKMDAATNIENRAFILIDQHSFSIHIDWGVAAIDQIQMGIIKTGITPAYNVILYDKYFCTLGYDTIKAFYDTTKVGDMGGSDNNHIIMNIIYMPLKDVCLEKRRIFISGIITYDDFFGILHHTNYNYMVSMITLERGFVIDSLIKIKAIGNADFFFKQLKVYNNAN